MAGKRITTDQLARMIEENVVAKMATKEDLRALNDHLDKMDSSLTRIENGHTHRIEKLEDSMRQVKTKLHIR